VNRALLLPLLAAALSAACGRSSQSTPAPRDVFPDPVQGFGAKLVVDAAAGHHLAAATPFSTAVGPRPVRYGFCAAACDAASSWAFVSLDELGALGGSVDLAVDGAGHPRLVWYSLGASFAEYRYAFCDGSCTDAASWTVVLLWPATDGRRLTRYLALASDGRPRLVWADANPNHTGVFYSFCDGDCTQTLGRPASGWHEVLLPTSSASADFALAVAPSGATRVGARTAGNDLAWLQCDTGCDVRTGWSNETSLFALGEGGSFALRLDGAGNPRLALYQDTSVGGVAGPSDRRLFYASCDGDCAGSGAWAATTTGLALGAGANGVDLALDATGRPRIAYGYQTPSTGATGVALATCDDRCESSPTGWTATVLEMASGLEVSEPRPVPAGFDGAGWLTLGRAPSLALDASGAVSVASGAEHSHWNGTPPAPELDEARVRLSAVSR